MSRKPLVAVLGLALVISSMQAASAAKQIAFSWSTSFTLMYQPGASLKAGVKPSAATLKSWAAQVCKQRYDFLYAETIGASGRVLGKSQQNQTKKASSATKAGWITNEYGEQVFGIEFACSGSMNVPVTGASNSYALRTYVQDYNEYKDFKTKSGIYAPISRSYSVEELNSNSWKIVLKTGQSSVGRCCADEVWGPAPSLAKIPDLEFKLVQSRDFNQEDQYQYGNSGKAYVFDITNYSNIKSSLKDFYLDLKRTGSYYGSEADEVLAQYDSESKQITIFVPTDFKNMSGRYLKLEMGHMTYGFVRWGYAVRAVYAFNPQQSSLTLKSKTESVQDYPLY